MGTGVNWIFSNEPILSAKYPLIIIEKIDNPSVPISIGDAYSEFEQLFLIVKFHTKNGFKVTISGTEYLNSQLVEYYQSLIKTTLKAQFNPLFALGVKNYKAINTSRVEYDGDTQLYFGFVTIRVAYFHLT